MNINNWTVGKDDPRHWLRQPFQLNGMSIASNGHRIIFGPLDERLEHCGSPSSRDIDFLSSLPVLIKTLVMTPMPDITLPPKRCCPDCSGTGKQPARETCPECDGDGELEFDTDENTYWFLCKTCGGDGTIENKRHNTICETCQGSGETWDIEDPDNHITIDGIPLQPKYIEPLLNAERPVAVFGMQDKLMFRCDEYMGAIMSIRK